MHSSWQILELIIDGLIQTCEQSRYGVIDPNRATVVFQFANFCDLKIFNFFFRCYRFSGKGRLNL